MVFISNSMPVVDAQIRCEGDRLLAGHNREMTETDPHWTVDAFDSKCTFATNGGDGLAPRVHLVAIVRQQIIQEAT